MDQAFGKYLGPMDRAGHLIPFTTDEEGIKRYHPFTLGENGVVYYSDIVADGYGVGCSNRVDLTGVDNPTFNDKAAYLLIAVALAEQLPTSEMV